MRYDPRHHIPAYRKRRKTNQAYVTIAGVEHRLGLYGSLASRVKYDELIQQAVARRWATTICSRAGKGRTCRDGEGTPDGRRTNRRQTAGRFLEARPKTLST